MAESTDHTLGQVLQVVVKKQEHVIERTDQLATEVVKNGETHWKNLGGQAQGLLDEVRRHARRAGWMPWSMAMGCAVCTILATTLLRPGWTMTGDQRRALRVGEAVIYTYSAATEADQREMRRVMRWRTPELPDSSQAPPVPTKRR